MVYKQVNIGALTQKQLKSAVAGKPISITKAQIARSGTHFYVHPENHKKIQAAKKKGTGTRIYICDGAIQHDLAQGGSLWGWLKQAAKDVYKTGKEGYEFVKDNWSDIKPYVTKGIDMALPHAMKSAGQYAPAVLMGRQALKGLAGVGIGSKLKGSPEAKARMAAIRGRKKQSGGSFRLDT